MVVSAPTGSGKSTRIPRWILEFCHGKVLIVEPRRVACRALARWVAAALKVPLGHQVGYCIRFESQQRNDTRLLFVTPGVALQYALNSRLSEFEVIILDEFHERGLETDLLLALILSKFPPQHLIIMSATIDGGRLAHFINGVWLKGTGKTYPVEVFYLGGTTVPSRRGLSKRVYEGVKLASQETDGHILVFLPGFKDINECKKLLLPWCKMEGIDVIPLHSSIPRRYQDQIFAPGSRKVILSTNIAESSLTIPGVTAVVDSGLVKQYIHRRGHSALVVCPISQDSAEQRKGRAGRTAPGKCYRLWDQKARLDPRTPAEIHRVDLTDLTLKVIATGTQPENLTWLDPPAEFSLQRSYQRLVAWGALDPHHDLTPKGRLMVSLPIPSRLAAWILSAPNAIKEDICDLCAALDCRLSLLQELSYLPPQSREDILHRREQDLPGPEPIRSILALRRGIPNKHGLHPEGVRESRRTADQLRKLLQMPPLESAKHKTPNTAAIIDFFLTNYPETAFIRRSKRDAWANGKDEVWLSSPVENKTQAAVILQVSPVGDRGLRIQLVGEHVLPCSLSQLRKAGVGQATLGKVTLKNGLLEGEITYNFAGRQIGRERSRLKGKLLREGILELIRQGTLFPGLWEALEHDCKLFDIYTHLNKIDQPPIKAETWLTKRLHDLGVEDPEDIQLISEEDLRFTLLSIEQKQALKKNYPSSLQTGAACYTIEYDLKHRKVILHWESGLTNAKISSIHLHRWKGWTIELEERGRITRQSH